MTIYIELDPYVEDGSSRVMMEHYAPFDEEQGLGITMADIDANPDAILVEALPPITHTDRNNVLMYDRNEGKLYRKYSPIQLSGYEQLLLENEELKKSLADLWEVVLFGGAE